MSKFFLTLVALGGMALAAWLALDTYGEIHATSEATGIITSADRKPGAARRSPIYPTVRYQIADGRVFEQQLFRATRTNLFQDVGKPIQVLYQPDQPESALINELRSLWGMPFSLVLVSTGCVLLAWSRRRTPWVAGGLISLLSGLASFFY